MTGRATIIRSGLLGVAIFLAAAGCAGSGPSDRAADFDPFGFPGDDSVVTAGVERTAVENTRTTPTAAARSGVESSSQAQTVMLVQFFTTTNYMEAEDVRKRASAELKEPVVVKFETPYYKLKAGPLPTREAADKMALRLRAMGYESAWVVQEQAPVTNKK